MENDSKSDEKSDAKLNLCLENTILHKGYSKNVEKHLQELTKHDRNINELVINYIFSLKNDNEKLKENNETFLIYWKDLENYLKTAQKDVDTLKENFRVMQLENNELLTNLKNARKTKDNMYDLLRKKRKISVENGSNNKKYLAYDGC